MRYAYDTTKEQMKKAERLVPPIVPSSKRNKILNLSKHSSAISLQGYPSFVEDNDCFVVDEPKHLRVYLLENLLL